MDQVIRNAQQRLNRLHAEIREVTRFIEMYQVFSHAPVEQGWMNFDASEPEQNEAESTALAVDVAVAKEVEGGSAPPTRGLSRELLRPHIRAAILSAGRPLSRGELLKALDSRGIPVGGTSDRPKNMGTILWRLKDEFVSLDRFGYWPRSEPYPPARYDPIASTTPLLISPSAE